jgi:hypothetical protein
MTAPADVSVAVESVHTDDRRPTWQCEFCGRFYSERTAKDHSHCIQEYDRRCAEQSGAFDV